MTCPAKITIAGVDYACIRTHDPSALTHFVIIKEQTVYWPEDIAPPERDIPAGQVVMDAHGDIYIRRNPEEDDYDKYPWIAGDGAWEADSRIRRPLTFLVPEPDPVDLDALQEALSDADISGADYTDFPALARVAVAHMGLRVKP